MSVLRDIFRGESNINFIPTWRPLAIVSGVLVTIAILALLLRGLNLGIEFEGGQSWELRSVDASTEDLRDSIAPLGLADARIQQIANDLFRVRAELDDAGNSSEAIGEVSRALADAAGIDANEVNTSAVGASWGRDVTGSAVRALAVFAIVIFIYIAVRLEWKMAVGALVAVIHDIIITVGLYALFQFEVTAATVIAFLTILGYSLYDTLVVFDKIKENERRVGVASKLTYSGLVSHSLNQVVMRSINTTITSVIPVLSVLIIGRFVLGAVTLQEFSIALLAGLIVGTYSSLFVATPLVAWLKEREPANVERRERVGDVEIVDTKAIAAELADADRSRQVREKARKAGGDEVRRITKTTAARAGQTKQQKSGAGSSTKSSGVTDTVDKDVADVVIPPRPRKKKKR